MSKRRKRAGSSPANQNIVAQGNKKKKKKKNNTSDCSSGRTPRNSAPQDDATACNGSDVGDFGGSVENLPVPEQNVAKVKLPPLVVKNVPLEKLARDLATLGIGAEYKLCGIGTKVMLRVKADFNQAVTFLKNSKAEFFTHDIPGDKPFKAVIRGLPNLDPKAIGAELQDRFKLAPTGVFRITRRNENKRNYPDCLFLVHFQKGTVTLNGLQAIRSLFSIVVRWEAYRGGRRDVTQCQRCLNFGHGTRNCHVKPRCGFCAQDHATSNCPVEGAVAFKCANCGGAHQGSDRKCSKREDFKRIRKHASTANQPRRKEKAPVFGESDFPPLPTYQRQQAQPRVHPPPPQDSAERSPTPPGFWRPPSGQNNNPELFTATELMDIFTSMTGALRGCRNKSEQIQVLGKFIIQYGV